MEKYKSLKNIEGKNKPFIKPKDFMLPFIKKRNRSSEGHQ